VALIIRRRGTLIAIAADEILMGELSELGPIDSADHRDHCRPKEELALNDAIR
jgi:hypothetical protein